MQLSASTPSSDTNLAALLLGGETAPAAAPGVALPAAAFEQLITGLTSAATPSSPVAAAAATPAAPEAPVALLVAPALRNFAPTVARASAAPAPAEAELPLPVPAEVAAPTVATAKAAPRPAPRAPARSPSAKSDAPTTNSSPLTPEQLPPVTPLAPQPLPTDLLTLAPAAVAAEESSPAEPTITPSGEALLPSAQQVAAPVGGPVHIPALRAAQLASRPGSTAAVVTPPASSAPPATAPHAAPESSDAAPEILPTPGSTLTPRPVAASSPRVPSSSPLLSGAPEAGISLSASSVASVESAAPDVPTPPPIHTFAPADLVSRQFTPSPRAAAAAAPATIAASFADSRSTDRLPPPAQPIFPGDVTSVPPADAPDSAQPVFSVGLPAADVAAAFTMPSAPTDSAAPAAPHPMSPEPAPAFSTLAPAAPVALAANAAGTPNPVPAEAFASALLGAKTLPAAHASDIPLAPKAKIAARSEIRATAEKVAFTGSDKNFLSDAGERVANTSARVGTDVAKSGPVMSTTTFADQPAPAAVPAHASFAPVARVEATDYSAVEATVAPGESASVADAHRAVEAVLVAADRTAHGDRHTVNLHFTVAGNELAVRVEMRADEVRATFQTASPELRDALAREWQAVRTDPSADSSLRLAPAVFTSGPGTAGGGSSSLGGDASSRQRDPGTQRGEDQTFFTSAPRSLRTPDSAAASSVPTSAPAPANSRGGTHRLHAHA